ncbi:MAG: zinc ribbon domain-containing protein [Gemmataceae bacterium]|nr:zinc ribbon domain-containing protein [Gemmataceae bacterium]
MPTYDYECDACEHRFEEFQSMMDKPLKKCPKCKKPKLRRLIGTGAAILFKGAGFYQTDYRSESYKSAAKADQNTASPNGKSDSAPAKPADAAAGASSTGTADKAKKSKSDT